jgi:uncharacterized protein
MKVSPTSILLQSGEYFDFASPETSNFMIHDIAHGESNICRFGGQSKKFYSVAEHSWHCSQLVPPEDALEALMHDASEALGLGDMVKPLKNMNPDYEAIENRIELVISQRFGFRFPYPPSVKIVDKQMLKAEQRQVMFNKDGWPDLAYVETAKVKINFWSPLEAELNFLERFYELMERNT